MSTPTTRRHLLACAASLALGLGAATAHAATTLTVLIDGGPQTVGAMKALAADFSAKNPDIKIELETRPGGAEGDNLVKTRLATGEMADVFLYNAGSLFQALNPKKTLVDLTGESSQANVLDVFKRVVTVEGRQYGVPVQTAMGGGVLYNRKVYAKLKLQVPKTWAEFQKNNAAIKAAGGVAPVIQTFKDTWSSQLFVLGDFHNVATVVPTFADNYTANKAKYASTPAALKSFQRQEEVFKAGYLNKDYASAKFEDGLRMVAKGEGAHYPMLTFAIGGISVSHKENIDDVGFFALPGDNAAQNGVTVWMPPGLYIPKSSEKIAEAKKFVAFVASVEGCNAQTRGAGPQGPYMVKGCELPASVPPAVADLVAYFKPGAKSTPALEYLSPVKGPSLEQITVEVGSGIRKPADAAALYDGDVRKQALQLGLPGWK
ncbi:ABC transporter substrate-binding protein [Sphaerotilus sp.]|uniref:ABC transporter substrate-binding protein n=1 Tax=Sphaerotilus sp. TaxID=2093942 RepID=UPI002ACD735D|nr:extracellular solute-binding protein [Sphaerotilus sp.]MDZ7854639.1 extracellular solute-binding protein [Sphaerotilus sp.]